MEKKYDIAVIGAGPGGYIAALRAAQLDKKVALVEEHKIGGTCMNYGCIPAKFLLTETKKFCEFKKNSSILGDKERISLDWKGVQEKRCQAVERLVKGIKFVIEKNGIHIFQGKAEWDGQKSIVIRHGNNSNRIGADKVILATGSRSADLPFVKADGERDVTGVLDRAGNGRYQAGPGAAIAVVRGDDGDFLGVVVRGADGGRGPSAASSPVNHAAQQLPRAFRVGVAVVHDPVVPDHPV